MGASSNAAPRPVSRGDLQRKGGRMLGIKLNVPCFYGLQGVSSVVEFDESWGMDLIGILPGIVTFRVALPFDQILQGLATSPSPVTVDLFHFVLLFPIN
jgi:hypothetical protein